MAIPLSMTDVLTRYFGGRGSIDAVYVFGSFAAGEARATSDVDIAVLYSEAPASSLNSPPYDDRIALEELLKRTVDLVSLHNASTDLAHRVLAAGALVVENNHSRRVAFEVATRNRYFDVDLIAKKLAFIETCIAELRHMAKIDLLFSDLREQRFIEHTLQLAIQSAIDIASHIVSDERLGEPETNAALFSSLARAGWLDLELARQLAKMAGFRNVLVHGYDAVDLAIVDDMVRKRLPDLEAFIARVRGRTPTK